MPTSDAVVKRRKAYGRRLSKLIEEAQFLTTVRDYIHPMLLARLTMGMAS